MPTLIQYQNLNKWEMNKEKMKIIYQEIILVAIIGWTTDTLKGNIVENIERIY